MKHRTRTNRTEQKNQENYSKKLNKIMFDISHGNADQMITIEEDQEFLNLQRASRTGSIGCVDKKLATVEKRSAERRERSNKRVKVEFDRKNIRTTNREEEDNLLHVYSSSSSEDLSDDFILTSFNCRRKHLMTHKITAVLDRTNTSIRGSTMIIASLVNEAVSSASSSVISKSTVHRQRQRCRRVAAYEIKENYLRSKCVVHWDGKLLPDIGGSAIGMVDRLAVLLSSTVEGNTKLLGVPKLTSGTGKATACAVLELVQSWHCESLFIGMCFDTTASNTGQFNGACTLLEERMGRHMLWLACRHHMFEVLLSDGFSVCFGPSAGPEILIFKRFRNNWRSLNHREPNKQNTSLVFASENLKCFLFEELAKEHPRDDYLEFLQLAALMVGLDIQFTIRKPGALHRARWMAKAIYSLKIELLFDGNESAIQLTGRELQSLQRFNRFVVLIYIQSWFTSRSIVDAPLNDIFLIQRLQQYNDESLRETGLKMIKRHSWYLSQELATLALFSKQLSSDDKEQLIMRMRSDRGSRLLKLLPCTIADLVVSRTFFQTVGINDSFLDVSVESWSETKSFKEATDIVNNISCINDLAERGVSLIQHFNETTKDEEQKQFMLQVVEKHRKDFTKCNRDELIRI